jgi:hypothetical protein
MALTGLQACSGRLIALEGSAMKPTIEGVLATTFEEISKFHDSHVLTSILCQVERRHGAVIAWETCKSVRSLKLVGTWPEIPQRGKLLDRCSQYGDNSQLIYQQTHLDPKSQSSLKLAT